MATRPRTTKGRAVLCARLAKEKQAHNLLILDLGKLESSPAEFFVIATVDSEAQMRAVTDLIERTMRELGYGSAKVDGSHNSSWVVLDYFDVVVHVMRSDARLHYNLERLWGDAKVYTLSETGAAKALNGIPRRSAQA
ncbi:MAG: ribosome silencing factor [Bradyrhizobiaceae bacterium]|nr:ribosome silencing factor [Bradyrhizobiaceae bacterium]